MRVLGGLTTNHTGAGQDAFFTARADSASPEAGYSLVTDHCP